MKKASFIMERLFEKGFAILTIFMMLGQLGQGAITALPMS